MAYIVKGILTALALWMMITGVAADEFPSRAVRVIALD